MTYFQVLSLPYNLTVISIKGTDIYRYLNINCIKLNCFFYSSNNKVKITGYSPTNDRTFK